MADFSPELIKALVAREVQTRQAPDIKPTFRLDHPPANPASMTPQTAATFGALADIAGTYTGLKRGYGEDNPMLSPRPAKAAMGLLAQLAAEKAGSALLRKFVPKAAPVADAIEANTGARQLGLGMGWARRISGTGNPQTGNATINHALLRQQLEQQRRK